MKKIDIPEIYPENIIELSIKDASAYFRYSDESNNIIQLFFGFVYEFDYTEEDYVYSYDEAPGFGLYEVYDSEIIKKLIEDGKYKDRLDWAFGGEYENSLAASVKRTPTSTTVWMLNRCINEGKHTEEFIDILKEVAGRTDVDKDIKKSAQEFVGFQANR